MQLVPLSNRVFRLALVLLFIAMTSNKGISEPVAEQTVNDTVMIRSCSPRPQNKPKQPSEVNRSSQGIVSFFEITAYSPTVAECDASPFITASGQKVYVGGIAADLSVLPFGSLVVIPGYNNDKPCEVIDTGGAIKGNKLDVFFELTDEAIKWGRKKNVPVTILRLGYGNR